MILYLVSKLVAVCLAITIICYYSKYCKEYYIARPDWERRIKWITSVGAVLLFVLGCKAGDLIVSLMLQF